MKKIFAYIVFASFTLVASAQGTLQFNQVKLINNTAQIVPAGKVWKVESVNLSVKDGNRVAPAFKINTDTVILGYDSYQTTDLENVTSIVVQVKGYRCTNASLSNFTLDIVGNSGTASADQTFTQSGGFTPTTSYSTLATFTPSTS